MFFWSLYSNLASRLNKSKPIHGTIFNFEGLACNSIHFIDFLSRVTSSPVSSVQTHKLDTFWVPSKRSGYFEVNGELFVEYENGSSLRLIGDKNAPYYHTSKFESDGVSWYLDQEKELATSSSGNSFSGATEFQSQITASLLDQLFNTSTCILPTLAQSSAQHRIFIYPHYLSIIINVELRLRCTTHYLNVPFICFAFLGLLSANSIIAKTYLSLLVFLYIRFLVSVVLFLHYLFYPYLLLVLHPQIMELSL